MFKPNVMAANARGSMRPVNRFPYKFIGTKMAENCNFMATKMFKWPKKFTFGVFRCFQLILKIFTENWLLFVKKKSFLSCLYKQIFNGKSIKSAWNALISLKMYLRVFSKILDNYILGYFAFFTILRLSKCIKRVLFG